jgi:4-amino-4-deoxy-L-arabinose transferase-like glycosyltransferase
VTTDGGSRRPALARRPVGAIAVVLALVMVATAGRYDYHRDELYFRLLGQHPAWGYVDQPPATPLLARAMTEMLGDHLWALRLPGAVILAATAILTAMLARDLGGGAGAQALAAAGAAGAFPLIFGHVLLTATLDLVLMAAIMLCLVRALREDGRWWLAVGGLTGLALYNKHLVVLTLLAVGLALLLVGPRRVLWSRWLLAGVGLAVLIGLPNVVYQVANDWPQLKMAAAIEEDKGTESRILFLPLQLALVGVFLVPVWIAGIVRLVRDPRVWAVGVAYPILCVLVLVTGGQPYYTAGLVLALLAAGAVTAATWPRTLLAGAVALNLAVSALVALPVLPVAALAGTPVPAMNQAVSDQIGWPVYVRQITDVYAALPPGDRERAVIVTANYGEAGALDRYGRDLPAVYSGHNELWYRGRPPDDATVLIAVGFGPGLSRRFGSCAVALELDNGVDIPNEEQDNDVRVCRAPVRPWSAMWPEFQHYS